MKTTKKSGQNFCRQIVKATLVFSSLASWNIPGQTNNTSTSTNAPATNVLNTVTVEGRLNEARSSILTEVGASSYTINSEAIPNEAQGNNASFNQVLLRAPGVAEDSLGQDHVRGEH